MINFGLTALWFEIVAIIQSETIPSLIIRFVSLFLIYFFPALVAIVRVTKNRAQVLVINLFLGRTFIAWVVALAMAFSPNVEEIKKEVTPTI